MSEYQYYEFQAVDRSLTPEQRTQLRALSTRAVITGNSFTNTYSFGDFRGNPRKLMELYFDAHVYVSNFGVVSLMLRLPRNVLTDDVFAPYANDALEGWDTDTHTILEWRREGEPPDEWMDGEGWMAQLLPIRDELVRGDYRSLYIGWLSSITRDSEYDEEDEDGASGVEPPVPAGFKSLTSSQVALAEFLGVSRDLLTAAARTSPDLPTQGISDTAVDAWVSELPESEVRAIVARLLHSEGPRLQTELQSRFFRARNASPSSSGANTGRTARTAEELVILAARTTREREEREAQERARKRHAQLAALIPRLPELWATVHTLAEEKKASAYDKVSTLLVDMRAAHAQAGSLPDFDARLTRFLGVNGARTALVRRLREAGLMS